MQKLKNKKKYKKPPRSLAQIISLSNYHFFKMNLIIISTFLLILIGASHQQQEDQSCNKRQLLWQMNRYRSSHRVPAFILDEGSILAVYSQQLAEYKASYRRSPPQELPYGQYGKTEIRFNPRQSGLADVVASMYNSSRWYRWYGGEPPREVLAEFGVFTQLVWYGSRYLAVGCAYNRRDGQREMVLGFSPAGNVVGGYARNVFPPAYRPEQNTNGDGGNVTPDRNTIPNDDDRRVPDDNRSNGGGDDRNSFRPYE